MRTVLFLVLFALLPAGSCLAGTVMVNGEIGRACYAATLLDSTPDNDKRGIGACDEAVANSGPDDHDRVAAFTNRADIRLRMKDFTAAVADSEQALALDATQPVAHLNRGAGLVGLKRYDDAVASLNKAIALDVAPLELAFFNRAMAKEALGDLKGAYFDYKKALELDPHFQLAADELSRFKVTTR